MNQEIAQITLVVADYDEAIAFYTKKLLFECLEDTALHENKRWVRIRPQGSKGCGILLAKASGDEQMRSIGNQSGGRVFLFLHTNDFDAYYAHLLAHQVRIERPPSVESFGKVAVFADLYGNLWDLIEPKGILSMP